MILKYIVHQINVKEYMCVVHTCVYTCAFMYHIYKCVIQSYNVYMCTRAHMHTCICIHKNREDQLLQSHSRLFLRKSTIPV